ncbi:hypothetical protein ACFPES_01250 [Paenibacillus sp. GCM10023248]|uniref:hypothetical protein n=1 Tax=Bacillales TaxID=1385 RepID=UPI002379265D|nr:MULTISPECIES: hypothetical protein [Bacillales]MDD9265649.1 hypothetical protein [Paenibacillus sp. MAHUQ-63]MDR6878889.1 putative membrane protein [Bacillus sp. 3255]
MGIIFLILVVAVLIGLLELPGMLRKKMKVESWVFSVLLIFGTILSILQISRIHIPNPLDWITYIYQPVSDFVFGILQ